MLCYTILMKAKITYIIQTRPVAIHYQGKRVRQALWGRWRTWDRKDEVKENVRDAIEYVNANLMNNQIGGVVVVRMLRAGVSTKSFNKIYQAKWGSDNRPFTQFDGLAGTYWQRELSEASVLR